MTVPVALSPRARLAADVADQVLAQTAPPDALAEIVQQAAAALGATGAQLAVLSDRLVVLRTAGGLLESVEPGDTLPFEDTICAHTLAVNRPLSVADARTDERFSSLDAVRAGAVASYFGVPVHLGTQGGPTIGVLCIVDDAARSWTDDERAQMIGLAGRVSDQLDQLHIEREA